MHHLNLQNAFILLFIFCLSIHWYSDWEIIMWKHRMWLLYLVDNESYFRQNVPGKTEMMCLTYLTLRNRQPHMFKTDHENNTLRQIMNLLVNQKTKAKYKSWCLPSYETPVMLWCIRSVWSVAAFSYTDERFRMACKMADFWFKPGAWKWQIRHIKSTRTVDAQTQKSVKLLSIFSEILFANYCLLACNDW